MKNTFCAWRWWRMAPLVQWLCWPRHHQVVQKDGIPARSGVCTGKHHHSLLPWLCLPGFQLPPGLHHPDKLHKEVGTHSSWEKLQLTCGHYFRWSWIRIQARKADMLTEVYMILLQSFITLKLEVNQDNVSSQRLLSCSLLSRTLKSKLGQFDNLFYITVTLRTQITSICNQSGRESVWS